MPKLSKFTESTRKIAVKIEDETINLTVKPSAWTLELEALQLEPVASGEDAKKRITNMFMQIVIAWDITDEDGEPLPITYDNLVQFPSYLLVAIMEEVKKAITFRKG